MIRAYSAKLLGMDASHIRVIAAPNGGGFGGKSDPFNHEICAAKMALKLGRPVKICLDRDDDMRSTGKRHDFVIDYEVGFDDGGLSHHWNTRLR